MKEENNVRLITTKELFDEVFKDKIPDRLRKTIDRPEIYEYEKEIGKDFIDMNSEELLHLIASYTKEDQLLSDVSYNLMFSYYRKMWNYYIENYRVIKNPFKEEALRGKNKLINLRDCKIKFTKDTIIRLVGLLHSEYSTERANYYECLLLLFYNGFYTTQEVIELKEDMIDFGTGEIRLSNRTIEVSKRCLYLLKYVNSLTMLGDERNRKYKVIPYRGGYFKFIMRESYTDFDKDSLEKVSIRLVSTIKRDISNKFGIHVNNSVLYYFGLYEAMVKEYGLEEANNMILQGRDRKSNDEFRYFINRYNSEILNKYKISRVKRELVAFT